MAHIPVSRLVHSVTIRNRIGQTGTGRAIYGEAVTIRALVAEKSGRTIGTDGEVVASSAQFVCRLADGRAIETDAEVTIPGGRVAKVVSIAHADDGGRGAWQHSLVSLQ